MNLRPDSAWVYNIVRSSTKQTRPGVTESSKYEKFRCAFLGDEEPLRIESYILSPSQRFKQTILLFVRLSDKLYTSPNRACSRGKTFTPLSVNDLIKWSFIDSINLKLSWGAFTANEYIYSHKKKNHLSYEYERACFHNVC